MRDAHLGGLVLTGSRLEKGLDLTACAPRHLCIWQTAFTPRAWSTWPAARIGGQLACVGGCFDGAGGRALNADGAVVGADVLLSAGFHATGEVNLIGANITGQLACTGGRFDGAGGCALNAQAAVIGAAVFFSDRFHATGEVNLVGANITNWPATGGRFDGAGGRALTRRRW